MLLLIADSDPTMTDLYETYFTEDGCEVVTVANGLQCIQATRQRMPDLMILEYELPWGGGDGVLECLREDFPAMSSEVVLITCEQSADHLVHELEPPVRGCLRKPFRLRELRELVQSVADKCNHRDC